MTDDTLTLVVAGRAWSGWEEVRVTRGVERLPSDFEIVVTERYPGEASDLAVQPGDGCQVKLGSDLVVTGYVDRYMPSIAAGQHQVRISGRGKCQDLVDCSADIVGAQISGASTLVLAQQLAAPFGITVSGLAGIPIPQFNVNLGETPWEIIERITRYSALLAYDGPDGNLILAQVGASTHASGFAQGVNVQAASATFAMDERFSVYKVVLMSVDRLSDLGGGGNLIATVTDPTVPRYRPRIIVSEQSQNGVPIGQSRANWELARRFGRSQAVTLTCDSWRDSAGVLWQPNALATLDLPALKLIKRNWVISEVSYLRSAQGSSAELTLMPPQAFQPQPEILQAYDWQVGQALSNSTTQSGGHQ